MGAKKKARRQQVRRQRLDRSASAWRRLRARVSPMTVLWAAIFWIGATAVALLGRPSLKYTVGQKTNQPIYAEVGFVYLDETQTLSRRQAAKADAPSHYRVNLDLITRIGTELLNLYQTAQASETLEACQEKAEQNQWTVDEGAYEELRNYASEGGNNTFQRGVESLRRLLASEDTWDPTSSKERSPRPTGDFVLVHGLDPGDPGTGEGPARRVNIVNLTPISNVKGLTRGANDLAIRAGFARTLRDAVAGILVRRMSESPMLLFDLERTNEEMTRRADAVEPVTVTVESGQMFIPPRPHQGLTAADLQLLATHDKAYRDFLGSDDPEAMELRERKLLGQAGLACVFLLMTVGLFAYTGMYQPRVLEIGYRTLGLVFVLLAVLVAGRVIDARAPIKEIGELIYGPPLLAASILAVAYNRRFALTATVIVGMMLVLSIRGDLPMLVTMVVGLAATVHMLNDIRTRTRLIKIGAISAAMIFISSLSFGLLDGQELAFASRYALWASVGALLSIMFLQGLLPVIERVFQITTSLTLLEWGDATKPLLQRLAQEAPGTYSHSVNVGDLANAACAEVGANGLLAKVGALYHDIGKIHKAQYFAENQMASINWHDNLAPTMSLLIIIGHVKDGMELAREYHLPRSLHHFIEEHHGTTVVRYFHDRATRQQPHIASGKHDREVPEAVFRYPGPKPRSRESAILMLCDGAESTVRSLAEPTPGRIENIVHTLVMDRLNDGQFDDCDITLRELHCVEQSLVKKLCSLYHGRVAYPKAPSKSSKPGAPQPERERKPVAG